MHMVTPGAQGMRMAGQGFMMLWRLVMAILAFPFLLLFWAFLFLCYKACTG